MDHLFSLLLGIVIGLVAGICESTKQWKKVCKDCERTRK